METVVMASPDRANVTVLEKADNVGPRPAHRHRTRQPRGAGTYDDRVGIPQCALRERITYLPHTSFATSTASLSFAHCSSSVRMLPSSVEAKPHCGDTAS